MADPDVLITSEPSKLPSEIAALLDPATPLPAGTLFFEKRYDLADVTHRLLMAIGFALAALIIIPFGVALLFNNGPVTRTSTIDYAPLGFGLLCALVAWMMFASIRTCWRLRRRQLRGESTRRGTFLTPAALVQAGEFDTTVIPPSHFRGLKGRSVKYQYKGVEKSYDLPGALVDATSQQLEMAIIEWAARYAKSPAQA